MTVAELRSRIGHDEYLQWKAFYGWRRWKQELAAGA